MKKNPFPFIIFIFAFVCFIALRIYAGSLITPKQSSTLGSIPTYEKLEVTPIVPPPSQEITDTLDDIKSQGILNDPWHDDFIPVSEFKGEKPRIICWGDSLTETIDQKTAYPDVLRTITGCEVINYGVNSENTAMIAMREGAIPVYTKATVIPRTCDMIPVFLETETGHSIFFLDYGDGGVNPCSIGDVEGTLTQINGSYYFARLEEGDIVSIDDDTLFSTFAMKDSRSDDVLVIFTGTNDFPDSTTIYDIIDLQRQMIKAAKCEKYIVIGLTYREGIDEINNVNDILANEYEEHFLDIRSYILNYGLEDAGIEMTGQDRVNLAKGEIPSSLRSDYVHGNKYFYELLAKQLKRKLEYLGYIPAD